MSYDAKFRSKSTTFGKMIGYNVCYMATIYFLYSNFKTRAAFGLEYAYTSNIVYYILICFMLAGIFVNLHYIVDVTVFSEDKAVYYQLLRRSHAYYPCDIRKIKFKKMKHHNLYYFYSKNRNNINCDASFF